MFRFNLSMFERFWFNDLIANEAGNTQIHVVCTKCSNKYDMEPTEEPRPDPPKGATYWYVWMLDHPADVLLEWMVKHLRNDCVEPVK